MGCQEFQAISGFLDSRYDEVGTVGPHLWDNDVWFVEGGGQCLSRWALGADLGFQFGWAAQGLCLKEHLALQSLSLHYQDFLRHGHCMCQGDSPSA